MSEEKPTAGVFVRRGYEVQPTSNGGFMVFLKNYGDSGRFLGPWDMAAFTNSTDFLAWLSAGHAAYDKEPGK